MDTSKDSPTEESLIEYPCDFSIKVMGSAIPEFHTKVLEIASKHDPQFNETKATERHSKNNKYLSITLNIAAQNREQLDALYEDLTACELSLWVL